MQIENDIRQTVSISDGLPWLTFLNVLSTCVCMQETLLDKASILKLIKYCYFCFLDVFRIVGCKINNRLFLHVG